MSVLKFAITIVPDSCSLIEFGKLGAAAVHLQNVLFQWLNRAEIGDVLSGHTLSIRPTHLDPDDGRVSMKVQLLDQTKSLMKSAEWVIKVPDPKSEDQSFYVVDSGSFAPYDIVNMIIEAVPALAAA